MEPSHTKPNTKRRDHMSAEQPCQVGRSPRGSPGVGREGTAPAGVRASGRAIPGQEPSWDQPGHSCSPGQQAGTPGMGSALARSADSDPASLQVLSPTAPAQAAAPWSHGKVQFEGSGTSLKQKMTCCRGRSDTSQRAGVSCTAAPKVVVLTREA